MAPQIYYTCYYAVDKKHPFIIYDATNDPKQLVDHEQTSDKNQ